MSCTIVIAHRDTPEWLETVVATWRLLEPDCPIVVIDTASGTIEAFTLLARLAQDPMVTVADLGYTAQVSGSDQVAAAFDWAFASVQTEYLLSTHTDVFPLRKDALRVVLSQCNAQQPVVGWEMSPRGDLKLPMHKRVLGRGIPGHAFTLYHLPTVRAVPSTWSLRAGVVRFGLPRTCTKQVPGWPDTETAFGFSMRAAGVPMAFLGQETNDPYQETELWAHARSRTVKAVCNQALPTTHPGVLAAAQKRLALWNEEATLRVHH